MMRRIVVSLACSGIIAFSASAETLKPAAERFSAKDAGDAPDFQRHIVPLMGRLGCNGRACHGSFQGQGGFRLSLFGYDFKLDHEALAAGDSPRINTAEPAASKILEKPTLEVPHKGGKVLKPESWEYNMLKRWIAAGGKTTETPVRLEKLEVEPKEIVFSQAGQLRPLRVTAYWANGEVEDVTCLSRFRTNNEAVAEVDLEGRIKAVGKGDTHVVAFYDNGVAVSQIIAPVTDKTGPNYPPVPQPTTIDKLVVAKLQKLGVVPSDLAGDAEFLRRVSLDMTGTLPSAAEIEAFLADSAPDKRAKKIDELLERPAHAAWWSTILCDFTGASPRSFAAPQFRQFVEAWYSWIHDRVKRNVSYKEIVEGIVLAKGREAGQSYDDYLKDLAQYFRKDNPKSFAERSTMPFYWMRPDNIKPEQTAEKFAHAFLGLRLECAQCHKHPYDQWTQQDYQQFMAFFTPVKYGVAPDGRARSQALNAEFAKLKGRERVEKQLATIRGGQPYPFPEVFISEPPKTPAAKPNPKAKPGKAPKQPAKAPLRAVTPKLLGGEEIELTAKVDPRRPLMDWLAEKDNPYFAAAFVNRVWAQYFGAGIIDPPDDQNLANPPSNPALLQYLTAGFVEHHYDMKWLHREIANSRTYQLTWRPNETNELDSKNFSRALVRRLPAEVGYDALVRATIADPVSMDEPAAVAKRAIGASVLANIPGSFALTVFGKPTRSVTCDCERSNDPSLSQSIYLQNDQDVLILLRRKTGWLISLKDSGQLAGEAVVEQSDELDKLKQRLERLDPKKNKADVAKLKKRIARLEQILAAPVVEASATAKPATTAATKRLHESIVREAFLRTVSRPPTRAELDRGVKQLESGKSPLEGLEDLMWALLNTKEFIVNH